MKKITYVIAGLSLLATPSADAKNPDFRTLYTVENSGRTAEKIREISDIVDIPTSELYVCNPKLKRKRNIRSGTRVKLAETYSIRPNDSLWKIAERTGTTLTELIDYNPQVKKVDIILPGQKLYTPCNRKPTKYSKRDPDHNGGKPSRTRRARKRESRKHIKFPSGLKLEVITNKSLVGTSRCKGYNKRRGKSKQVHQKCEFYDPNNSGNYLLRINKSDLGRKVSPHFTLAEFAHIPQPRLTKSKYTQKWNGDSYYKYIRLDPSLIRKLEKLRKSTGALRINSGYRSFGYNYDLYWKSYRKKPTFSRHTSGDAVDVHKGYYKIRKPVEKVFRKGGVGKARSFTHVDDRKGRARWTY
jgi:LysM repeat protein